MKCCTRMRAALAFVISASICLIPGCDVFSDAAIRLASEIKAAARKLESDGDKLTLYHQINGCEGPYSVQFDKVGALVIWCRDATGKVISSPGTSLHGRYVETSETFYLDKAPGQALVIALEKRGSKVLIVNVH